MIKLLQTEVYINSEINLKYSVHLDIDEKVLSQIKAVERKEIQEENSQLSKLVGIVLDYNNNLLPLIYV